MVGVVQPADAAVRAVPPRADSGGSGVPGAADGAHAGAPDRGLPLVAVLRRLPGRPGGCADALLRSGSLTLINKFIKGLALVDGHS